ncbi:MAG: RDD family protein [Acidobacteriota bacterium]|nr:RDD family protein [Acidobacteriota bacterium]MDH3783769.1 RDD family protein [Acidobacteriota bacterium]
MQLAADRVIAIETPDGASIDFELPTVSERFVAFVIDLIFAHAVWLLIALGAVLTGDETVFAAGLVTAFMIRNFYFAVMELAFSGRTAGKMMLRLRVIARDGGPLTAQAVLARNLTRDLEWLLPLVVLMNPSVIVPSGPLWGRLLGGLWFGSFMLLPLFNRHRLRVGDLIGGTLVIKHGRRRLDDDLTTNQRVDAPTVPQYRFSQRQLEYYGVLELQTLEKVLRLEGSEHDAVLSRIAEKISNKIGWDYPIPNPEWFLRDFYRAQRAHLEQRMLFGDRKETKAD